MARASRTEKPGVGSRVVLDPLFLDTLAFLSDELPMNSTGGFGGEGFDSLLFPTPRISHPNIPTKAHGEPRRNAMENVIAKKLSSSEVYVYKHL